jgi:MoaA/NifB/PqqE/SkfB family radical SAM enzyme
MDINTYREIIGNIQADRENTPGGGLKYLHLAGFGEPLLHPEIAEMVGYARDRGIAEKICIITNGYCLTPELSDRLISAGLGELRVSLQGLDAEAYEKNCGIRVDFERLRKQLEYFYEHRGDCVLYVKIPNNLLKDAKDKERFEQIFSDVADIVAVENLIPSNNLREAGGEEYSSMLKEGKITEISVCSGLFTSANVDVDGTLYACCFNDENGIAGPRLGTLVGENALGEIWNHGLHLELCRNALRHRSQGVCASCRAYKYWGSSKDYLDGHEAEILKRYETVGKDG